MNQIITAILALSFIVFIRVLFVKLASPFKFWQLRKWIKKKHKTTKAYLNKIMFLKDNQKKNYVYFHKSILLSEKSLLDLFDFYKQLKIILKDLQLEEKKLKKEKKYKKIWLYFNPKLQLFANILNRSQQNILHYWKAIHHFNTIILNNDINKMNSFDKSFFEELKEWWELVKNNYSDAISQIKEYQ